MRPAFDPTDPAWFPVEYDQAADAFLMAPLGLEELGRYPFLDRRMELDWGSARPLRSSAVSGDPPPPAFLFHTAFCGSTVLARALHAPPRSVALKEPRALMLLSHASLALEEADVPAFRRSVAAGVGLLARPWSEGGRVLIKPTNAANRLLPLLLEASPRARAVLLHGALEPFLYSCCRKLPEAETRLGWMARHLIANTALAGRLEIPPGFEPGFVEACVLTWAASIERYAEALAGDSGDRLTTLSRDALFADPARAVAACAEWLGLDAALAEPMSRVSAVFATDAKLGDRGYDRDARAAQQRAMQDAYGGVVRDALAWSERVVLPALTPIRDWKPLLS